MKKYIFAVIAALVLNSCVGMDSTYRPMKDFTGGYGEEKIKNDVYVVFFDGNGFTSKATAKKYFLRRSSALTLQNGFSCFKILDQKFTLSQNFMSQAPEVVGSKYYYKTSAELSETEKNTPDENSIVGVIQIFPDSAPPPKDCYNAKTTLEATKSEN